jgi:hypothetical protein
MITAAAVCVALVDFWGVGQLIGYFDWTERSSTSSGKDYDANWIDGTQASVDAPLGSTADMQGVSGE